MTLTPSPEARAYAESRLDAQRLEFNRATRELEIRAQDQLLRAAAVCAAVGACFGFLIGAAWF